jgi:hypothetical protein
MTIKSDYGEGVSVDDSDYSSREEQSSVQEAPLERSALEPEHPAVADGAVRRKKQ